MRRLLSVGLVGLSLVACGDSFSPEGIAGTYNLTTVNGTSMPATITVVEQGVTVQVVFENGTLTLRSDGTYLFSFRVTASSGGVSITDTETDSGTFLLQQPSSITFTSSSDGGGVTASWSGGRITITAVELIDNETSTLVFRKQ